MGFPLLHSRNSLLLWKHLKSCHLRFAILTMMQCVEDDLICWFGVKCSSSTAINVGTSRRSFLLPQGDESKVSVRGSKCLVARWACKQLLRHHVDSGLMNLCLFWKVNSPHHHLHLPWRGLGTRATSRIMDAEAPPREMDCRANPCD